MDDFREHEARFRDIERKLASHVELKTSAEEHDSLAKAGAQQLQLNWGDTEAHYAHARVAKQSILDTQVMYRYELIRRVFYTILCILTALALVALLAIQSTALPTFPTLPRDVFSKISALFARAP